MAFAQGAAVSIDEVEASLEALFDPIERARDRIDETSFDPDALAFELAFEDAETIVAHVQDAVAFEPYAGVLRGVRGTLASGAGNAWDQALLTARLLADAGYEAEIRRAELSDPQIERLLRGVAPRPAFAGEARPDIAEAVDVFDPERAQAELGQRLDALAAEADAIDARLSALPLGDGAEAMERVREATRDYAWVAYRLGDEAWSEAHPALRAGEPFALEARETFAGSLPAEVQHRFRYQVFVERKLGSELDAQPITEAWERPTANMYGVPLTYVSLPDGIDAAPADAGPAEVLAETSFIFPMIGDDIAPGGQAFDMSGAVVPMDAVNSPFAGIFQTVGGALGDAAGALGGLGSDEPADEAVALSAQWIEFTLIAPGGAETTYRRTIVDRVGAEARSEGRTDLGAGIDELAAFEAVMSSHSFMLDTGRYQPAYVADETAEATLALEPYVRRALEATAGGPVPSAPDPETLQAQAAVAPLALFASFDDAPRAADVVSFRPAPALAVLSQRLDGTAAHVDVVANPRWSLEAGADGLRYDAAATRRYGAWETRVEANVLAPRGDAVVPAVDMLERTPDGTCVRSRPARRGPWPSSRCPPPRAPRWRTTCAAATTCWRPSDARGRDGGRLVARRSGHGRGVGSRLRRTRTGARIRHEPADGGQPPLRGRLHDVERRPVHQDRGRRGRRLLHRAAGGHGGDRFGRRNADRDGAGPLRHRLVPGLGRGGRGRDDPDPARLRELTPGRSREQTLARAEVP